MEQLVALNAEMNRVFVGFCAHLVVSSSVRTQPTVRKMKYVSGVAE